MRESHGLAAEAAVRAVDRSLESGSATALLSVLSLGVSAEARRRVARVLDLKASAALDPRRLAEYERAAEELREWAARLYLALREEAHRRSAQTRPRPFNPHSEAGISIRRHLAPAGRETANGRSRR